VSLSKPASPSEAVAGQIRAVLRGHAPNCSSAGSVVGMALVSTAATAVIVNAWALRFLRWTQGQAPPDGPGGPPRLRVEADGSGLLALPGEAPGEAGGVLHLEPALVATARAAGAREVGLAAPVAVPGALRAPTEVHLAVTDRCPVRCTGCYLEAGPERPPTEPGAPDLRAALDTLAAMGVLEVAFGGGEVLLRADLLDLLAHARDLGLVPNLTTSGFGLSQERARALAGLVGQVNVSLDGLGESYRATRGWNGADRGLAAIGLLAGEGVRVGVNTVLARPLLAAPGALEDLGAAIVQAGAREWQWLRFKPAGRGADAYAALSLDATAAHALWPLALALEAATGLVLRFDCALVPFLVAHRPPPALLQRMGVRGCPGGHSLWARAADGAWAPCSFVPGQPQVELGRGWAQDPALRAWRERAAAPPGACADCDYQALCRGGCRAVSAHLVGDPMAPDPECPRVQARAAS